MSRRYEPGEKRRMMEAHIATLGSAPKREVPAMNPNSALIWLPKVEALGFPSPRTVVVPYDHYDIVAAIEGGESETWHDVVASLKAACEQIGSPCFLRTDLSSAKHDGPKGYLIQQESDIPQRMGRTVEDNEMKFWLSPGGGPKAFLVREFLDLDSTFTAFGGLPVAREWRFFADENHVVCHHQYWPSEAIGKYVIDCEDWRERLARLHTLPAPETLAVLDAMAIATAKACGGGWSVDFAMDKSGKWWLIDAATAGDSWHWPGCEFAAMVKNG